jgi:hypothetical protein
MSIALPRHQRAVSRRPTRSRARAWGYRENCGGKGRDEPRPYATAGVVPTGRPCSPCFLRENAFCVWLSRCGRGEAVSVVSYYAGPCSGHGRKEGKMLVHRSPHVLVVLFALLALPACARDTLTDTHTPYASGLVALAEQDDTVSFSTGLGLSIWVLAGCLPIGESPSEAIVGYLGVPRGQAGIDAAKGATPGDWCVMPGVRQSRDTLWNEAGSFPDSLRPLDTLGRFACYGNRTWSADLVARGWSCYYACLGVGCPDPPPAHPSEGWNVISYVHCPDSSHMKIEFVDDSAQGRMIHWAVDSAGNGLFETGPTAVSRAHSSHAAAADQQMALSRAGTRAYTLQGRAIPLWRSGASAGPGVFVVPAQHTLRVVVP